jgi:hypothetical protein
LEDRNLLAKETPMMMMMMKLGLPASNIKLEKLGPWLRRENLDGARLDRAAKCPLTHAELEPL